MLSKRFVEAVESTQQVCSTAEDVLHNVLIYLLTDILLRQVLTLEQCL